MPQSYWHCPLTICNVYCLYFSNSLYSVSCFILVLLMWGWTCDLHLSFLKYFCTFYSSLIHPFPTQPFTETLCGLTNQKADIWQEVTIVLVITCKELLCCYPYIHTYKHTYIHTYMLGKWWTKSRLDSMPFNVRWRIQQMRWEIIPTMLQWNNVVLSLLNVLCLELQTP